MREPDSVGLMSHYCDNCKKPISFLSYRGKKGEYCGDACYIQAEGIMTDTKDVETTVEAKPAKTNLKPKTATKPAEKPAKAAKPTVEAKPKKVVKTPSKAEPKKVKKTEVKTKPEKVKTPKGDAIELVGVEGVKMYRASSACGVLFKFLASDQKPHTIESVLDTASNAGAEVPANTLWFLIRDMAFGGWVIEKKEGKVTLKLKK